MGHEKKKFKQVIFTKPPSNVEKIVFLLNNLTDELALLILDD